MKYIQRRYSEHMGASGFIEDNALVNEFEKIYKKEIAQWCSEHSISTVGGRRHGLEECIDDIALNVGHPSFIESFEEALLVNKPGELVIGSAHDDMGDVVSVNTIKCEPKDKTEATKLILEYIKKYNISNLSIFETLL